MKTFVAKSIHGNLNAFPSTSGQVMFQAGNLSGFGGALLSRADVRRLNKALGRWLAKPAKKKRTVRR